MKALTRNISIASLAVFSVIAMFFVLLALTVTGNSVAYATADPVPAMQVELQDVRWDSYADYIARVLSVSILFQNVGDEPALDSIITSVSANGQVEPLTEVPKNLGTLEVGATHTETLTYSVPVSVSSYRTRITMSYLDSRQTLHFYPEVPPPDVPVNYVDVTDYGAAGNGVADDTSEIQAAINDAPDDYTVLFPAGTYKISSALTVSKPLTLLSNEQATIKQVTTAKSGVIASGAGPIEVKGLHFTGKQYATRDGWGKAAIAIDGVSPSNRFVGITIENCVIDTWGEDAIYLEYANDLTIKDNYIEKINYAGMYMLSVSNGTISGNTVDTVVGSSNAYGIAVSRDADHPLDPRSSNISIVGNTIRNVPHWEGIDTHAGENLTISGNTVESCWIGIAVGASPGDYDPNRVNMAPLNVTVESNLVDFVAQNGSAKAGIRFTGVDTPPGNPSELATGSIVNNTIKHHGEAGNGDEGSILLYNTQSIAITGNNLLEPAQVGISLEYNNYNVLCSGNSMTDTWSNSQSTYGVYAHSAGYNTGTVYRPTLYRGSKIATYINNYTVGGQNDPDNHIVIY